MKIFFHAPFSLLLPIRVYDTQNNNPNYWTRKWLFLTFSIMLNILLRFYCHGKHILPLYFSKYTIKQATCWMNEIHLISGICVYKCPLSDLLWVEEWAYADMNRKEMSHVVCVKYFYDNHGKWYDYDCYCVVWGCFARPWTFDFY